jgi:hypothetical protein
LYILLLSVVVIITNSLRPHHHHYHQVCYISDHCKGEKGAQHDDGQAHDGFDHSHNHPFNDQCKVNTVYILPYTLKIHGKLICTSQMKEFSQAEILAGGIKAIPNLFVANQTFHNRKQPGLAVKILVRALRAPPLR